jgi:hypothetical protein
MTPRLPAVGIAVAVMCCLLASGTAAPAAGAEGAERVRPVGLPEPLGNERLSDEERLTRHARAIRRARVHVRADVGSPTVAWLRYYSEDGPDEIYLALRSRVDAAGRVWVQIRVPMRPRPQTGWVARESLGRLRAVRTKLRVNRRTLRATLMRDGRRIWSAPVGIGTRATPTPAGRYWVRTRLRGLRELPMYGPWAFGTSAYSILTDWPGGGVIGIHGTDEPQLIPGRPSHGCIRLRNRAIRRLARLLPIGTPLEIL